jgi:hypothetical protein
MWVGIRHKSTVQWSLQDKLSYNIAYTACTAAANNRREEMSTARLAPAHYTTRA